VLYKKSIYICKVKQQQLKTIIMYQLPNLNDIKLCRPSATLVRTLREVKEFQKNCRTLKDFNASEKIIKEINSKFKY